MKRKKHGSDVCFCGDYRSQHRYKRTPCGFLQKSKTGKICFCGCPDFKWGHRATKEDRAHWRKYHSKAAVGKAR